MIIKIERHRENQEYWLLDGISKISVSEFLEIGEPDDPWVHYDITIYDHLENLVGDETYEKFKPTPYQLLVCRLESGKEMSIGFDTVCYIMNDSGKTMEKLVVNYKGVTAKITVEMINK